MKHPKLADFESRLKKLFDEVDDYLEETYGGDYPLHPARPPRGETSNKESSGLFNVGAAFSAGFGSELGRGYVLDIDMVTLANVDEDKEERIIEDAVERIHDLLPKYFPERDLEVSRDGRVFKIHGDLSLGHL